MLNLAEESSEMPLWLMRLGWSGFSSNRRLSVPGLFRCQFVLFGGNLDETRRTEWIKMEMQLQLQMQEVRLTAGGVAELNRRCNLPPFAVGVGWDGMECAIELSPGQRLLGDEMPRTAESRQKRSRCTRRQCDEDWDTW